MLSKYVYYAALARLCVEIICSDSGSSLLLPENFNRHKKSEVLRSFKIVGLVSNRTIMKNACRISHINLRMGAAENWVSTRRSQLLVLVARVVMQAEGTTIRLDYAVVRRIGRFL